LLPGTPCAGLGGVTVTHTRLNRLAKLDRFAITPLRFADRTKSYRMQGKFVKKLTDDLFELTPISHVEGKSVLAGWKGPPSKEGGYRGSREFSRWDIKLHCDACD
jgi:hypothetical protein